MERLIGKTLEEMRLVAAEVGLPRYAAGQMMQWIYGKRVGGIDGMTNLSKAARETLSARYEVGRKAAIAVQRSEDGTVKYLFPVCTAKRTAGGSALAEPAASAVQAAAATEGIAATAEDAAPAASAEGAACSAPACATVETVFIPDGERGTLCVSCQVGCKMGCQFCMTGRQGFHGNLTVGDIMNQVLSCPEFERLTNIVFMGQGEPFDNLDNVMAAIGLLTSKEGLAWSPRRITVSTVGLAGDGLRRFCEQSECHLAVSLHHPDHEGRMAIMPAEKAMPVADVIETLRAYDWAHQRRLTFEYIVFDGLNNLPAVQRSLASLLNGLPCRVNLIRFHTIPDTPFRGAGEAAMEGLRDYLNRHGITCTIRASRGEDIMAACGLLNTQHKH